MPGLPRVIVPHPVAKLLPDQVMALAEEILPQMLAIWQADAAKLEEEFRHTKPEIKGRLRYHSLFEGNFNAPDAPAIIQAPEDLDALNRLFYQRGWTDGLPVVPPTEARHRAMIGEFDPDTLVGLIEPRQGQATVSKIAANAVMAGCIPAHFPAVVAAARGLCAPALNVKALNTTTHPCTIMALVSGPLATELDINAGGNAMGQGTLANAAIGRAIRFMLLNIGGGTAGILDRATLGTPAKYAFCFAEMLDASPWGETLHMERGFDRHASAITLCGVEGPHNVNDHYGKTAEEVLLTLAGTMAIPGANNSYLGGEILIVLGPEHAEIIARDGFSKADIKDFLIANAIIPGRTLSGPQRQIMQEYVPHRFLSDAPDADARVVSTHSDIMLTVAGGIGRHSCIIPSFGNTAAVTLPIVDAEGKAL